LSHAGDGNDQWGVQPLTFCTFDAVRDGEDDSWRSPRTCALERSIQASVPFETSVFCGIFGAREAANGNTANESSLGAPPDVNSAPMHLLKTQDVATQSGELVNVVEGVSSHTIRA
jgi:hypothetical protein